MVNPIEVSFHQVPADTSKEDILEIASRVLCLYSSHPFQVAGELQILRQVSGGKPNQFIKRLCAALETDVRERGVVERVASLFLQPAPSSLVFVMQSLKAFFQKESIDHLRKLSESLLQVPEGAMGRCTRHEFLRLFLIPTETIMHENAAQLITNTFERFFSFEEAQFWVELVFDAAVWNRASELFIQFLEKQHANSIRCKEQYYTLLAQVLQRYMNQAVLYEFVERQLQCDLDEASVGLLCQLLSEQQLSDVLQNTLCRYEQLRSLSRNDHVKWLRLAFFLESHLEDILRGEKVFYCGDEHKFARSICIDNQKGIVLVQNQKMFSVFCKTTRAERIVIADRESTPDQVVELCFENISARENVLPEHLIQVAEKLKSCRAVAEFISYCRYDARLAFFCEALDERLAYTMKQNTYVVDLAEGLHAMHSQGISHGAISLDNARLRRYPTPHGCWTELEHATWQDKQVVVKRALTSSSAPERHSGSKYDLYKCDIWEFGAVLFQLAGHTLPWTTTEQFEKKYHSHTFQIRTQNDPYILFIWEKMMHPEPAKRVDSQELLDHLRRELKP